MPWPLCPPPVPTPMICTCFVAAGISDVYKAQTIFLWLDALLFNKVCWYEYLIKWCNQKPFQIRLIFMTGTVSLGLFVFLQLTAGLRGCAWYHQHLSSLAVSPTCTLFSRCCYPPAFQWNKMPPSDSSRTKTNSEKKKKVAVVSIWSIFCFLWIVQRMSATQCTQCVERTSQ